MLQRNRKEDIINFEVMGGWPMYRMNLRDIIVSLGGKLNKETNKWEIDENEVLNTYPRRLKDDGMGYGVDEEWIVSFDVFNDRDKPNEHYCNVFTERGIDYAQIWVNNHIFPGCGIVIDGERYTIDCVDETDEGFMFQANKHDEDDWRTIIDKKLLSEDKLKEILGYE